MGESNKTAFFFIRTRDLEKISYLCNVLWDEHGINTRVEVKDLAAGRVGLKDLFSIKNFIEDFKSRNGNILVFVVNDDNGCSYKEILKKCTKLPIHTLSLVDRNEAYELARQINTNFDFLPSFTVG